MLKPGTAQTFEDYFNYVFAPYIAKQLETVQRVDVVWDVYHEDPLKNSTREKWDMADGEKFLHQPEFLQTGKAF